MSVNAHEMLKRIQTILRQEGISTVIHRIWGKLLRESGVCYEEAMARRKGSYSLDTGSIALKLRSRLDTVAIGALSVEQCIPQQVAQLYLDHRFDLLGSGWVQVRYGMHVRGMSGYRYDMSEAVVPDLEGQWLTGRVNSSNLPTAQRIWQRVHRDYQPIDWQLDFKSGYRWSERTWAMRLPTGPLPGVDVKVPWELSRMQHLPQMALRASAAVKKAEAQQLMCDIRDQWLDFIATNPPGFGVNWLCPMDIAIRGANWCLTWDILQAAGFALDPTDETILAHSLYDHGRYIVEHLEWSNDRANHYLADICGLAFIAAYLPETRETDHWLAFAIGQLHVETLHQFLRDGGNIEGSTAYHRLSTEMVLYATALILGLSHSQLERLAALDPKACASLTGSAAIPAFWSLNETGIDTEGESIRTPFDAGFLERVQLAVSFFAAILKPDGSFPQIGDNDSGRFFKLQPMYSMMTVGEGKQTYLNLEGFDELDESALYFLEDGLKGGHLLRAARALGIFDACDVFSDWPISVQDSIESIIITALTKARSLHRMNKLHASPKTVDDEEQAAAFLRYWDATRARSDVKVYYYPLPERCDYATLRFTNTDFHDFGCFVFHHPDVYLLIRCVVRPEQNIGVHYHDDQLSIELEIAGKPLVRDPGTFVYTALPKERNRYRSAMAHFSPHQWMSLPHDRTNIFDRLLIQSAMVEFCGPYGFAAHLVAVDQRVDLLVSFGPHSIEIMFTNTSAMAYAARSNTRPINYSPGYGVQEKWLT